MEGNKIFLKASIRRNTDDKSESEENENTVCFCKEFIQKNFKPIGNTIEKEFISSAEIVYLMKDVFPTNIKNVSNIMSDLKFKSIIIDSKFYWVVFIANTDE